MPKNKAQSIYYQLNTCYTIGSYMGFRALLVIEKDKHAYSEGFQEHYKR